MKEFSVLFKSLLPRFIGYAGLALSVFTVVLTCSGIALAASEFEGVPAGTAFVVNPAGYLLTCAHVVDGAEGISVVLGGKSYQAAIMGIDTDNDIALLKINASGLRAIPLADPGKTQLGESVRAFGFPLTSSLGDSLKVTKGSISGIEFTNARKVFQTDASVNPGNSGGPLVNDKGEVVGIVNAKLTGRAISNVGFAVPVNYARPLLRDNKAAELSKKPLNDIKVSLVETIKPAVALVTTVVIPRAPSTIISALCQSVQSVAFSPDGQLVASAGINDIRVRLWDSETGELRRSIAGCSKGKTMFFDYVSNVLFSQDGSVIAGMNTDCGVTLWNATTGEKINTLSCAGYFESEMCFSPDGKLLATTCRYEDSSELIRLWDVKTGLVERTMFPKGLRIEALAFSPDGKILAAGGIEPTDDSKSSNSCGLGKVLLLDAATGKVITQLTANNGGVLQLVFSPDGKTLAGVDKDPEKFEMFKKNIPKPGIATLWDVQSGLIKRGLVVEGFSVRDLAFSPDGKLLAAACLAFTGRPWGEDDKGDAPPGRAVIWHLDTGKVKATLPSESGNVISITFSPEGKRLACGLSSGKVTLWSIH